MEEKEEEGMGQKNGGCLSVWEVGKSQMSVSNTVPRSLPVCYVCVYVSPFR